MNYRKDIYEKVKFMLKDNSNVNINCQSLLVSTVVTAEQFLKPSMLRKTICPGRK